MFFIINFFNLKIDCFDGLWKLTYIYCMNIGPLIIEFATLLHDYTCIWFVAFFRIIMLRPFVKDTIFLYIKSLPCLLYQPSFCELNHNIYLFTLYRMLWCSCNIWWWFFKTVLWYYHCGIVYTWSQCCYAKNDIWRQCGTNWIWCFLHNCSEYVIFYILSLRNLEMTCIYFTSTWTNSIKLFQISFRYA